MISETDLIQRFFRGLGASRADVLLGIGNDAALLRVAAGEELVLTTDALIEGVHFLPGAPPPRSCKRRLRLPEVRAGFPEELSRFRATGLPAPARIS